MSDTLRDPSGLPAEAPGAKAGAPPPKPRLYDTVRRRAVPSEAAAAMKDPACRVGRFVRVNLVGKGGMGTVYRGWEPDLGRWVALKFLKQIGDDTARAFFRSEARLAASLDHPNIAKIYEVGEHEGLPFIAMQFVDGESLASAKKGMSLEAKLAAVESVAEAVKAAHERRVIHRDLKPSNVMIDGKGHVTVMDFGLAKETAFEGESARASSLIVGTPNYMAPEQARGKADRQSDLYGIGAILYELVTGRPPFTGENAGDVLTQVMTQEIVWPRKLVPRTPADVEAIILKALEKERKRRYRAAHQLLEDLAAFRAGNPLRHARRPTIGYVLAKKIRKQPLLWGAVAAAIVAIVGGAAFGVGQLARRLKTEVAAREADARAERERRTKEEQVGRERAKREEVDLYAGYERDLDLLRANFYRPNYRLTEEEFAKYRKIADRLREQMGKTGESAQGWYLIGRCHEVVADYGKADRAYAQALEANPRHARTLLARGRMGMERSFNTRTHSITDPGMNALAREQARDAAGLVRRGAEASGTEDSMERDLAEAYLAAVERGNTGAVYSSGTMLKKWGRETFVEEFILLDGICSNRDLKEACHDVLARMPSSYPAYLWRGIAFRDAGDPASAIADFGKAITINPLFEDAYDERGMLRGETGDGTGALEDFCKAIDINPNSSVAYNNRGVTRSKRGDVDSALADFNKAIEIQPRYAMAFVNRGGARLAKGDADGAIADCGRALEIHPRVAAAYVNRASARNRKGDFDGAMADYATAIEIDPRHSNAYVNRAVARQARGDFDGAIADFTRVLEINPKDAVQYWNRGNAKRDKGDPAGALADYGKAIEIDPRMADAYCTRGSVRHGMGDADGARADYERALRIDPRHAATYVNRGCLRDDSGDIEGAIADYSKAIDCDPRREEAYLNRGIARGLKQDRDGAIADFGKVIDINPKCGTAYRLRGFHRGKMGDTEGAIADFGKAIEVDPRDADAYYLRGGTWAGKGDSSKAIADLEKALEVAPKGWRYRKNTEEGLKELKGNR